MVAAAQLLVDEMVERIALIRARRRERRRPDLRAAVLESALAWLARATLQAPDAARARLLAALGWSRDALAAPTRGEVERALAFIAELAGETAGYPGVLAELRALLAELGE